MTIPKLRFNGFHDEWEKKTLGEVCIKIQDGNYGGDYPKSDEFVESGIPFLTSKAIGGNGILIESKIDYLPPKKHNELKKAHLKLNDVLFTNRGSNVGAIGFVDSRISNGNIGPQLTLLRTNESIITPLFLKNSMETYGIKKQIASQDSGSAMNFFGIKATSKFKIFLPSLPEQQKIASFLSAVDKRISLLQRKSTLLEDYKKGVMQKLFSQQLRFKDDKGQDFPDWEEKKLGTLLDEVNEKTTVSNQHTILSSTAKGLFNQSDYFNRDIASKDNSGYKILRKNQLVFSPQNLWLGNINVNTKFDIGIVSPSYKIFKFNEKLTTSNFCKYFLFTNRMFYEYAQASEQGASVVRRNLDMSSFKAIPIKLPSKKEQQKIASFLESLDKKIATVNQQIEGMQTFKKGLLQQMFV